MSKILVVAANRHRRTHLGRLRLTQVSCWSIFFVLVVACWPEYFYNFLGVHRFGKDTKRISSVKRMDLIRLSISCIHILAYAVKGLSRYNAKQYNRLSQTLKTYTLSREANIGDSRKTVYLGLPSALCIRGNDPVCTSVAGGGHGAFGSIKDSLNASVNNVVQRFSRGLLTGRRDGSTFETRDRLSNGVSNGNGGAALKIRFLNR